MSRVPSVFISYAHRPPEIQAEVLRLSNRLRQEGIASLIDRYVLSPEEGWPRWMERRIRESDFVLLVCTESYLHRVEHPEDPEAGRGVKWEANLIASELYERGAATIKYVPIGFREDDRQFVPAPLRHRDFFNAHNEEDYIRLYRLLTNQPEVVVPELGVLRQLPVLLDATEAVAARVEAQQGYLQSDRIPLDYFFLNHTSFLRETAQERFRQQTGYPGDIYDIQVIVDSFDRTALEKVDRVRYDLGPGWPRPVQETNDRPSHFLLKELAFASPLLKAELFLKNNPEPITLHRYLTLWTSGPHLKPVLG